MIETITCPQCGHRFSPVHRVRDIQCPQCGTLQVLADEGPTRAQTELDQPITRPGANESVRKPEERTPPEGMVSDQKNVQENGPSNDLEMSNYTSSHPTLHRGVRTSHLRRVINAFGPVFLVCMLFLGWFAYDKLIRRQPHQQAIHLLSQGLRAFRQGDTKSAKSAVEQAIALDPEMGLGHEILHFLEQSEKSDR